MGIEIKSIHSFLVNFLKERFRKFGFTKTVIGLSGGVDSSVSFFLAVEALGKDNVLAVMMPYKTSSPESIEHAQQIIKQLGVRNALVDITPMADEFRKLLPDLDRVRLGNVLARLRMITLYDHSAKENALVIGTSNKTEILLGYGTLFGDTASAINPLGDLYKTQVWELAKELGVPAEIINKTPSADLWAGQTDEGELGFSYNDVDKLFVEMIDNALSDDELFNLGFYKEFVIKVRTRIRSNEFKRRLPVIAVLPKF
jgi:NAD+ synthase